MMSVSLVPGISGNLSLGLVFNCDVFNICFVMDSLPNDACIAQPFFLLVVMCLL